MYEGNCVPLPEGDASVVFAEQLAEIGRHRPADRDVDVTPETVLRWADSKNQPYVAAMSRRLLLPSSDIVGSANLRNLVDLARDGNSCLLCLNHQSNFDVPTMCALLQDHAEAKCFEQIIWIAGRKLEEDIGMTSQLVQCFNRVIVTPPSWFAAPHSDDALHQARLINIAAERAIARLRHEGWVFALFPSGTRVRPGNDSTKHPIEQTDSYLRSFDYLAMCNIDGCTMPVSKDSDLMHEVPRLDRMLYTFGPVHQTKHWRAEAGSRFPNLDQRVATARAIEEDIDSLAPTGPDESLDQNQ